MTRRRGIYLLPNALTTGALFAGFYAIVAAINGSYTAAAWAVLAAGVFDGVDGRVARLTGTQSDFGVQYDSLSDLISFGVAPALLVYTWALHALADTGPTAGRIGWLAAFVYTACTALRLARFNCQVAVADKRYFQGLASPAAAGTLACTVWFFSDQGIAGSTLAWPMAVVTPLLGVLMFSQLRYWSFKALPISEQRPLVWAFVLILGAVLVAFNTSAVLLLAALVYVVSGIVVTWRGRSQRRRSRP